MKGRQRIGSNKIIVQISEPSQCNEVTGSTVDQMYTRDGMILGDCILLCSVSDLDNLLYCSPLGFECF